MLERVKYTGCPLSSQLWRGSSIAGWSLEDKFFGRCIQWKNMKGTLSLNSLFLFFIDHYGVAKARVEVENNKIFSLPINSDLTYGTLNVGETLWYTGQWTISGFGKTPVKSCTCVTLGISCFYLSVGQASLWICKLYMNCGW